jgi:hypothetical protein
MTGDLVKRLRDHCFSTDWQVAVADSREAADRIEKLQAALRYIAANTCCDSCQEAAKAARAVLGEK